MMLETLIQELESYTAESFGVCHYATRVKIFYDLHKQGMITKQILFIQIQTIIDAQVDRLNNHEVSDKIKLDSFLYRFKEWLER